MRKHFVISLEETPFLLFEELLDNIFSDFQELRIEIKNTINE